MSGAKASNPMAWVKDLLAKLRLDPYIMAILASVVLAGLFPVSGPAALGLGWVTKITIGLLFFLHGARLPREAVIAGFGHWRLHLTIIAISFALFPLLGLSTTLLPPSILPKDLGQGVLFLCCLPSTVQSSIAFTSTARGNVAAAVVAASASNLLGVILTPLLVGLLLHAQGSGISMDAVKSIIVQLLIPFALGQASRRWTGTFVIEHKSILGLFDRRSILLVVYSAFSGAVTAGLWTKVGPKDLATLLFLSTALLAIVLALSALIARRLGFSKEDEIAIVFAGSKKSLASGVPIAGILFSTATAGVIVLPLMIFHQLQLMACALIAQRYGRRDGP
jgi:solute carrier family 10 (sodium/bile acid cotransporter), member 7